MYTAFFVLYIALVCGSYIDTVAAERNVIVKLLLKFSMIIITKIITTNT